MIVRTLQRRFTVRREDGTLRIIPGKIGTIRAKPWEVGRTYDIRIWTDKPYRSKQEHVAFVKVHSIDPITVPKYPPVGVYWMYDKLAVDDGFRNWIDMRDWFEKTHGLPCRGWHMMWQEVTP
jgi:hypothetical protein